MSVCMRVCIHCRKMRLVEACAIRMENEEEEKHRIAVCRCTIVTADCFWRTPMLFSTFHFHLRVVSTTEKSVISFLIKE